MASKKNLSRGADDAFGKMFSGVKAAVNEQPEEMPSPDLPKKVRKTDTLKVFSFRGQIDDVLSWRAYADAAGLKVDDLGSAAMKEYIKAHPLTAEEKKVFEVKMKQKKGK